ncbi:DUF222 domain-containing protein [Rhodococcus sp. NPDC127528]|uniref:HNH endonuclease signature motif containing protein n=1 Tax=unclassified Rhodococcus (in: high G+C Gram-positive bacteria) TaxID=192944 RepID=UPI003630D8C1
MFDMGDVQHPESGRVGIQDPAADGTTLIDIAHAARLENHYTACKVLTAGRFWQSWIERDAQLGSGDIVDCGNNAITEIAVRLGCSKTMAESYATTGVDLHLRLPLIRAAFQAGDLDYARVRTVCRETTGLHPDTTTALEPEILTAARSLTPGPLATEIARLVTHHAPEEAAQQREEEQAHCRRIAQRRAGTAAATLEITTSPDEAQQFMQLVTEFAATVCPKDKRGKQCRMVDAVMAIMHGEPYLACTCGSEDCNQSGRTALPGRRTPLTQITIDVATVLGLLSEPAYLHGHGLIDPDLARQLAADGTWQAMLTEALDLAEQLGLTNNQEQTETDSQTRTCQPTAEDTDLGNVAAVDNSASDEPSSTHLPRTPEQTGRPIEPREPQPTSPQPTPRFRLRSFLAQGRRRKAGHVPDAGPPGGSPTSESSTETPSAPPASVGTMAEAMLAAIAANPTLALGEHPDGHGGLTCRPDGALTYRPDVATSALVRARDQHCRFPGCTRPAAQCQLDHIVEYLAHDPVSGGWTIVANLQCLCQFHHQLKTLGLWDVTALPGHALLWTSANGTSAVTLPAGAHHGNRTLETLAPAVTGRRGSPPPPTTPKQDPPPF